MAEQPHDYRIVGEYDEEEDFEIYGCEGQRSRGVMCSRCECKSRTDIEPLGHNFVNGVCTRCAKADPNYTAPTNPPAESTSAPIATAPVEVTTEEATTPDSTEATEEDSTEEPDEDTTAESAEEQIVIVEAVEEVEEEEILDGAEPEAKNAGAAPEQDDAPKTGTVVSDTADDHKWIWIAVGAAGAAAAAALAAVFIIRAKKVK